MIKVISQTYFADIQENRNLYQYLKENTKSKDIFVDYIKERFNATYVRTAGSPSFGYFLFENERDAVMFMLRWG